MAPFHVLRRDVVLQVLHTGLLQKLLQFIPSPIVGIKLLQGEVDGFRGLLGACHPYGRLWLETYKGTSIHSHIEEDMGFRALLRWQLTAQGATNSQRKEHVALALAMDQLHQAFELGQVELQAPLCALPALWILPGLELENGDVVARAFQRVCQQFSQRGIALVPHMFGVWEVGDLEHVQALGAIGVTKGAARQQQQQQRQKLRQHPGAEVLGPTWVRAGSGSSGC